MDALVLKIGTSTEKATSGVLELSKALSTLNGNLDGGRANAFAKAMDNIAKAINSISSEAVQNLSLMASALRTMSGLNMGNINAALKSVGRRAMKAAGVREIPSVDQVMNAGTFAMDSSNRDILQMKRQGVAEKLAFQLRNDNYDYSRVSSLSKQYQQITQELSNLDSQAGTTGKSFSAFCGSIVKSAKGMIHVPKIFSQTARIMRTMAIRAAIRGIVKYTKQGVDNLYKWSKSVGGTFASDMDKFSSTALTLKNALGTALAPVLQSLVPIFNTLASWIREACNSLSQFFALLRGQNSWTKATDAVSEYNSEAQKAGANTKSWLADWDQLNVMSSSGGGSSNGAVTDVTDMFEEVSKFDNGVIKVVEWLEKHLPMVKDLAISAAAGLSTLMVTKSIKLALVVGGITLSAESGYTWGYNYDNKEVSQDAFLTSIAGVATTALGGAAIGSTFGLKGAVIGAVVGLAAGVASVAIGYAKGKHQAVLDSAFGDIVLDDGSVLKVVEGLFNKQVKAQFTVVESKLAISGKAKIQLNESVNSLAYTYNVIKLGVDTSKAAFDQIAAQAQTAIDSCREYITANQESLKGIISLQEMIGMDTTAALSAQTGYGALDAKMIQLGRQLSNLVADGIQQNEKDIVLALVKTITDATNIALIQTEKGKNAAKMSLALNRGSFTAVQDEFTAQVQSARQTAVGMYGTVLGGKYGYLATLQEGTPQYAQALADIKEFEAGMDSYVNEIVQGLVKDSVQMMKQSYSELLGDDKLMTKLMWQGGEANFLRSIYGGIYGGTTGIDISEEDFVKVIQEYVPGFAAMLQATGMKASQFFKIQDLLQILTPESLVKLGLLSKQQYESFPNYNGEGLVTYKEIEAWDENRRKFYKELLEQMDNGGAKQGAGLRRPDNALAFAGATSGIHFQDSGTPAVANGVGTATAYGIAAGMNSFFQSANYANGIKEGMQNALISTNRELASQTTYLRTIANKPGVTTSGSSAIIGRTVGTSIGLYAQVAGRG